MTNYNELMEYMRTEPKARERKLKDRAIVNILLKHYPQLRGVDKDTLVAFVKDHNSYDRCWRMITMEHEYLRGSDYYDKKDLSERKMVELGYRD